MFRLKYGFLLIALASLCTGTADASSGTEGASFLDIPVGGAPAALGSIYTSQANNVYAPVWNPAGLGFLDTPEFSGTHLNYISPVYYEHAGLVVPLGKPESGELHRNGIGASIQYLGTSDIESRDENQIVLPSFKASFAAYSFAYGHRIFESLSAGVTAKLITEKISDATANSYAADLGLLYKPNSKWNVGAALANVGPGIKFVNESDPLPTAGRLGAMYRFKPNCDIAAETVYRRSGLLSGSLGLEWRYGNLFSFRGGYNSARSKELSGAAGFTADLGVTFWGQELDYAWVPLGDLGQTHYFTLILRWTTAARADKPRMKPSEERDDEFNEPDQYHDIFDILNDDERKSIH